MFTVHRYAPNYFRSHTRAADKPRAHHLTSHEMSCSPRCGPAKQYQLDQHAASIAQPFSSNKRWCRFYGCVVSSSIRAGRPDDDNRQEHAAGTHAPGATGAGGKDSGECACRAGDVNAECDGNARAPFGERRLEKQRVKHVPLVDRLLHPHRVAPASRNRRLLPKQKARLVANGSVGKTIRIFSWPMCWRIQCRQKVFYRFRLRDLLRRVGGGGSCSM